MRTYGRMLLVGAAVAVLWLAGCANDPDVSAGQTPRNVSDTGLMAKAQSPVPDLPVPIGFSLDQSRSFSRAAEGSRWVIHYYTGHADHWAVARFYKKQMPAHGWTLESDRMIEGPIHLDFTKGSERCEIVITQGSWLKPTVIYAEIY